MMFLPVDEAYAFDYLAILMTKSANGLEVQENLQQVTYMLKAQLGDDVFHGVLNSPEFEALCQANADTFDMVERAISDRCKASDVDSANHKRMMAKAVIQERFFNRKLTELKTERPAA